jgi:hypothetical protein
MLRFSGKGFFPMNWQIRSETASEEKPPRELTLL